MNGIFDAFQDAGFEIDTKINRRSFGDLLTKTTKKNFAWAFFSVVSDLLYVNWKMKSDKLDNSGMFLPAKVANSGAQAVDAAHTAKAKDIVLSAAGTAVATITPPPIVTATLTG